MKYPDISKAVEQEILASYDKLYRLAFSYVKNEQDAMDVVQESVYKAMKNASQIKEKKYIKTWLWRIVINTAVDATRHQSRFVSDDQVQEEGQEDRYEDTDIMAALDTLEEKERKVIMLKVFEEWTIREIADCLHENPGNNLLVIYDVITSCGCTKVNYSKEGIRPGDKAELTVIYEAEKAEHFSKTVTIYCNADNSPLRLKVTGNAE